MRHGIGSIPCDEITSTRSAAGRAVNGCGWHDMLEPMNEHFEAEHPVEQERPANGDTSPEVRRPTDSVRIVLFDLEDPESFLALTEADDTENWKLPGGKFDHAQGQAEAPDGAAARELEEEIGLAATDVGLVAVDELVNDDGVSARYIFAGRVARDQIQPTSEIAEIGWFTEETLPESKNRGHVLSAVAAAREQLERAS